MISAIFVMAVSANAQYVGNKLTDNWSVGVYGGIHTPAAGHKTFGDIAPTVAVTVTKYFNPVWGVGVEGQSYVNAKGQYHSCTLPYTTNVSGLAYFNVTNFLLGYVEKPRFLEIEALYGLGWGHIWTKGSDNDVNYLTSKAGVNINFNLGKKRAWSVVVRPAVVWDLDNYEGYVGHIDGFGDIDKRPGTHYNLRHASLELTGGIVYHFLNSNGKHYMENAKLYDQAEIDNLNATINELRNELAAKPRTVVVTDTVVDTVFVNNTYYVAFEKGSYTLGDVSKIALNSIDSNASVEIVATASPEGSDAFNQKLSENRAKAVADYLTNRGVTVVDAKGLGVTGKNSQRVAKVVIK